MFEEHIERGGGVYSERFFLNLLNCFKQPRSVYVIDIEKFCGNRRHISRHFPRFLILRWGADPGRLFFEARSVVQEFPVEALLEELQRASSMSACAILLNISDGIHANI